MENGILLSSLGISSMPSAEASYTQMCAMRSPYSVSSSLIGHFFSSLVTSNFASGRHTIAPSYHLPFASPSLAQRNARSD